MVQMGKVVTQSNNGCCLIYFPFLKRSVSVPLAWILPTQPAQEDRL